jgi:hypothetical protein
VKKLKDGSQNSQIETLLRAGMRLTPLDAQEFITPPCMRLAARVAELKGMGLPIQTAVIKTASGARIAQYSL